MNTCYNRDFGKNSSVLNKNYSAKGIYKKSRRKSCASVNIVEAILNLIDMIVGFVCCARVRIVAKAVFGFVCLIGVVGIIGRVEMGTLPLLSGCIRLGLIILVEFLVIRQK